MVQAFWFIYVHAFIAMPSLLGDTLCSQKQITKSFCIHIPVYSRAQDGCLACPDRIVPIVYTVLSHSSNWSSDSLVRQLNSCLMPLFKICAYYKDKVLMERSIYILTEINFKFIVILSVLFLQRET